MPWWNFEGQVGFRPGAWQTGDVPNDTFQISSQVPMVTRVPRTRFSWLPSKDTLGTEEGHR
jgi:hypothetical protein